MEGRNSEGGCTALSTLHLFFDKRAKAQRSEPALLARFPLCCFLFLAYDNYVRQCRKIKEQRSDRVNKMVAGTMRVAGCILVPVGFDFSAVAAAFTLHTVTLHKVLANVSTDAVFRAAQDRLRRSIQVAMVKAKVRGVAYPPQNNSLNPETVAMHTLEFSLENSGTIARNKNILSTFQNMFQIQSESDTLQRSFGFFVGDQLTYAQMQRYKIWVALSTGVVCWIYPIPGDFHFYWHIIETTFDLYWEGGLCFLALEQSYDTGMLTNAEIDAAADEAERALERRQEEWDMEQAELSYWEPDSNDFRSHVDALSELAGRDGSGWQWEGMDNDTQMEDAVGP